MLTSENPLNDFDTGVFKDIDFDYITTSEFDSRAGQICYFEGVGVQGLLKKAGLMGMELTEEDAANFIKYEQACVAANTRKDFDNIDIPEPQNYNAALTVANRLWNEHVDKMRKKK